MATDLVWNLRGECFCRKGCEGLRRSYTSRCRSAAFQDCCEGLVVPLGFSGLSVRPLGFSGSFQDGSLGLSGPLHFNV